MAASAESARVAGVVEQAVSSAGLVLEDVTVTPAGRRRLVRIIVDLPETESGSVDLDRVGEVSRDINAAMDEAEPFGQIPYVLEVSSPGVDRPLTERRHWARARGRLARVGVDEETVLGRVLEVDDAGVLLAVAKEQVKGRPAPAPDERLVPWSTLGAGRVQVEFSRGDEDAAVDDEDEIDDEIDDDLTEES